MARATPYDAILLDVMLPGLDGFDVCRKLRETGVWTPILMLSALDGVEDRVAGLDSGADDYLTKPFSFDELLARLRALTRRGLSERPTVLEVGSLRLDPATREVWRDGVQVELSAKEFALLETFMRRPGHVLSRLDLLDHAWDYAYENRSNVVDVVAAAPARPRRGRPPRRARVGALHARRPGPPGPPKPAWVSPSSTSWPAPTAAPHTRPTATAVPTPGSLPDHRERPRPAAVTTHR
jgi:DNA-binding response OmpR family regulator